MNISKFRVVLLAGAIVVGAMPISASAASQMTNAFLANLQANVAFLDHSSRVAIDHAADAKVRDFASAEANEQSKLASALNGVLPLLASTDSDVVSGRSVAIDGVPSKPAMPNQAANGRVPMAQGDLDRLTALTGRRFDDLYWQTQLDALSQIEADYRAYIANGDDPVLVAMAKHELPAIVHRLELLSKI